MELKLKIKTVINSKILLQLFIILMISGCSTILPPTFEEQSATYNRTMEQYQINQIFTNIIRASEDRPIAFNDIPSVLGNANTTTTVAPGLNFGADGDLWSGGLFGIIGNNLESATFNPSQMYSEGFTFTQSSMDNATFWNEFMTKIPMKKLVYFRGNNIPEELILKLLIDEFVIEKASGEITVLENDPSKPSYLAFEKLFKFLIKNKLTFGSQENKKGNKVEKEKATLCISDSPKANSQYKFNTNAYCNIQKEAIYNSDKLFIPLRSVKNIFDYLGAVAAVQLWDEPIYVELSSSIDTYKQTRTKKKDTRKNATKLLVVERNSIFEDKFAYTEDLYGNSFIIPAIDAGYSQKVIAFLSELLILTKIPGSTAPQPGVLLQ